MDAQHTTITIVFDNSEYAPQIGDVIGRIKATGSYLSENWYNLTLETGGSSGDTIGVEASLNNFIQAQENHHGEITVTYSPDRYNVTIEEVEIY